MPSCEVVCSRGSHPRCRPCNTLRHRIPSIFAQVHKTTYWSAQRRRFVRLRLSVRLYLADAFFELFRFEDAARELIEVSKHNIDKDRGTPISATALWIKLAKVFLAEGDGLYRAAAEEAEDVTTATGLLGSISRDEEVTVPPPSEDT